MDNNEIKIFIKEKVESGLTLAEIQKALGEEKGVKITFMELRILASELDDIDWSKNSKSNAKDEKKEDAVTASDSSAAPAAAAPIGKTIIEMSKIERPGVMASGTVQFMSGASAEWLIDNTGRCGLDKVTGQPTQEDFMDFQTELQKLFS